MSRINKWQIPDKEDIESAEYSMAYEEASGTPPINGLLISPFM